MRRSVFFALAAGLFCLAPLAWSAPYDKGQPLFFQGQKTNKDHEEMLRGFGLILKEEPQARGKAAAEHGIKMLLQSPAYGYEQGKDFFLFLRFKPADARELVRLNLLGSFDLEMIDMTRARIEDATYAFDDDFKKQLKRDGVEAVSLGISEVSVPEVNIVLNLGDFNLVPPADGVYRIKITYRSESPDNSVWTGTLVSNPILIEVGQTS